MLITNGEPYTSRGVRTVLREGVENLSSKMTRRLYPTLRPAAVTYSKSDAGQLGVPDYAEPGANRQARACQAHQHFK